VLEVSLLDALGKEVRSYKEGFAQSEAFLNIRGIKPGLYWVKIKTASGVAVERLVKK